MIKTNYNAQDIWLLDIAPDWDEPFVLRASILSNVETGLTIRESRRNYSGTLRLAAEFGITAEDDDARRVEAGLKALMGERVVVPLWPAKVAWGDRAGAPIVGGLKIAFKEDFSQFTIYEGIEPGWPAATDWVAPLMWGRFESRRADWLNPSVLEFKVQFTETSPPGYAVGLAGVPAYTAGPLPPAWLAAGQPAPDIFPFEINLATPEAEDFSIEVLREQVGFGREPAETFYPQVAARELTGEHDAMNSSDAALLLKFFLDHGTTKAFWVPNWASAAVLTANMGIADTVLHVDAIYNVSAGDYLALIVSGKVVAAKRVTAVGVGTVTLDSAPGAFAAGGTLVCGMVLSRFKTATLEMQWISGDVAECNTQFREVVEEYAPAGDETLAVTQGGLPTRCWLYEFSRVLNGVTFIDRFTSYESDITYGGNTYSARKIVQGAITAGLELDADNVQLETDAFVGNPLIDVAAIRAQSPVTVKVIRAEVNAGAAVNAKQLFAGEVVKAPVKGSRITASAVTGSAKYDLNVPRPRFQTWCNNSLFDKGCGLSKADWKFTALMVNPGVPGYPFTFELGTLARSAPVKATVERGRAANVATLKVVAHGYVNGTVLKITLLGGAGYNQTGAVVTVIDADHFSYPNVGANEGTTGDVNGRVTWDDPAYTADWFSGGWIEFKPNPGQELSWSLRQIVGSTNPVAGALTVTLDGDPLVFPIGGDAVVLFPGCDLTKETCGYPRAGNGKFNNYLNFLGHPFLPIANPSVATGGQPTGGSKK